MKPRTQFQEPSRSVDGVSVSGTNEGAGSSAADMTEKTETTQRTTPIDVIRDPKSIYRASFESFPPIDAAESFRVAEETPKGFIPPHGGYENLLSFQKAKIVFHATVYFCARFISRRDRTYDQMIQAARSGKQNIVEGSEILGTSKEMEIKLTSVARASQEELLNDFRDFLEEQGLEEWSLEHRYTQRLRQLNRIPGADYKTFRAGIEHRDPAICANVIIGLIKVTTYLLDQQIKRLEQDFIEEGGMRERMLKARIEERERQRRRERGD